MSLIFIYTIKLTLSFCDVTQKIFFFRLSVCLFLNSYSAYYYYYYYTTLSAKQKKEQQATFQTKCILHGELAERDHLREDVYSTCDFLGSRVMCDRSVSDAQMTRWCKREKQKQTEYMRDEGANYY